MLVITRKPDERIIFPTLNITVQILRLTPSAVKLGIEAPPEVCIVRHELEPESPAPNPAAVTATTKKTRHALANALSKLTLAMHLARKQWAAGQTEAADATLSKALQSLETLEREPSPPASPTPFRALVVEDDPTERELLVNLLGLNGCECASAVDGVDALDYLTNEQHQRPDVVLLDMAMPRRDGPETLRMIRSDERLSRLRVYSVSSTSPEELNIPNGPMGFDGWFPKPLNPGRLWEILQSALSSPPSKN